MKEIRDDIEPLSEVQRRRIRSGIERKLAAGYVPPVPEDPVATLGAKASGTKLVVGLVAAGLVAGGIAAAVILGGHGASPERLEPPRPTAPSPETTVPKAAPAPEEGDGPLAGGGDATGAMPADPAPASAKGTAPRSKHRAARKPRPAGKVVRPRPSAAKDRQPTTPPPASQPAPASPGREGLAAELALVEAATAALENGQPTRALDLAREHARRFPAGALAPERERVAIAALCDLGRVEAAKRRAERFYARHRNSPLVPAVRATCVGDAETSP